jgi:sulfofructose kinase
MIIGLGCIAYDRVLFTNALWEDGKGRIQRTETRFGGNVRTALTAAAGLDAETAYLATVSSDPEWDNVLADLTEHGVGTQFLERAPGAHPALSTIIVTRDGDRFIAYDDSSLANTPMPSLPVVESALAQATVLMVDASTAPSGTFEVITQALALGIPVVLDAERPAPDSDIVDRLLSIVDHPILPLNFARQLTGRTDPTDVVNALFRGGQMTVTVTDGANGAYVRAFDLADVTHVPAFEVEAIDTVGCGDVFHGAYAVGLDRGLASVARVRLANAAAAIVAATPTGHSRIPNGDDVVRLLDGTALG